MAVQKPVAPTPPVPPSVPQVTLQEGGTARESNVPQNIQQNNDERLEAQARQSVAQGDGALSKSTTTRQSRNALQKARRWTPAAAPHRTGRR